LRRVAVALRHPKTATGIPSKFETPIRTPALCETHSHVPDSWRYLRSPVVHRCTRRRRIRCGFLAVTRNPTVGMQAELGGQPLGRIVDRQANESRGRIRIRRFKRALPAWPNVEADVTDVTRFGACYWRHQSLAERGHFGETVLRERTEAFSAVALALLREWWWRGSAQRRRCDAVLWLGPFS